MTISPTSTNSLYSLLSGGTQNSSTSSLLSDPLTGTTSSITDPTQLLLNSSGTQTSSLGNDLQSGTNILGTMQIAEKALSTLAKDENQLSSIATQLKDTSLSSTEQAQLQQQATALTQAMQKTVDSATFNGKSAFGTSSSTIGGVSLTTGVAAPDLSKLDVSNPQSISDFLKSVSTSQSTLGGQIVETSNAMTNSVQQSLMQSLDSSSSSDSTNSSDYFSQSYDALQQSMMSLNTQSLTQAHNTSSMQSSINSLLG